MKKIKLLMICTIIFCSIIHIEQVIGEEKTQELDPLEWFEISSGTSIGTNHVIEWSFTSTNPDIVIDVWVFDDPEFSTFSTFGDLVGDLLTQAQSSDSGYYFPATTSVWHVVFFNNDGSSPATTTVTANVEFVEESTQNDGNSGGDAGGTFAGAVYLESADFNSSGILEYLDCKDYYKFLVSEALEITIVIENLRNGNCNFTLYKPAGSIKAQRDQITTDETIIVNATETGYWIMSINKASCDDYQTENYTFKIMLKIPPITTTPTEEGGLFIISFLISCAVISIIFKFVRKKRK
ncbi:MAG: hypothetical protein KAQ95_10410 [Candidatus Heimdallarchaeota archaeon]|nr:hypothetical protein [Candidatus Heimdallarchaeota archaeon]